MSMKSVATKKEIGKRKEIIFSGLSYGTEISCSINNGDLISKIRINECIPESRLDYVLYCQNLE